MEKDKREAGQPTQKASLLMGDGGRAAIVNKLFLYTLTTNEYHQIINTEGKTTLVMITPSVITTLKANSRHWNMNRRLGSTALGLSNIYTQYLQFAASLTQVSPSESDTKLRG